MTPQKIFISYSHNAKDRPLLDQLLRHIAPLIQTGKVTVWEDSKIMPGNRWEEVISQNLENADIVMLLVSSDYLASDYVNNIEVPTAMQRQKAGQCTIVPVLLRSCLFELMPYAGYEFLPKTADDQRLVPLDKWENKDEAFAVIIRRLNKILSDNMPASTLSSIQQSENKVNSTISAIAEIERQGYEKQLSLATQKLQRLQTAHLLETNPSVQFALEQEIGSLENTVKDLKTKLLV